MIPWVRASRGADLIINHLHLTIIVYVHTVPPSEWLHQGLVSYSREISVVPCTQISTRCLQSHTGAGWIFYLGNQDLCPEFCLHNIRSKRWLSVLTALCASWEKGLLLLHSPDRQTDRQTDKHSLVPQQQWEPNSHSSTSAVLQSSAPLCSCRCYHLMLGPTAYKPHAVYCWATTDCD